MWEREKKKKKEGATEKELWEDFILTIFLLFNQWALSLL